MMSGMQMKLNIPAPVNPKNPDQRRPISFQFIRNMQTT